MPESLHDTFKYLPKIVELKITFAILMLKEDRRNTMMKTDISTRPSITDGVHKRTTLTFLSISFQLNGLLGQ
jgi:hypothetical protein